MSQSMMPSYYFWISQAQRYQKSVSFASPMPSWTPEMLAAALAKQVSNAALKCNAPVESMGKLATYGEKPLSPIG